MGFGVGLSGRSWWSFRRRESREMGFERSTRGGGRGISPATTGSGYSPQSPSWPAWTTTL